MTSSDKEKWEKAMQDEMKSLHENQTYELTELPQGKRALKNKWVYKIKHKDYGQKQRYKVRIMVKGCNKKKVVDFEEIFYPVVKMTAVRTALAMTASLDLKVEQMNVKTTFLHSNLDEEIYIKQPEGFRAPGCKDLVLITGNTSVKVVILNRPRKLNSLSHEMICQIKKNLELYENDSSVKLVILKGNGKAFCAGGDIVSVITSALVGHWTYPVSYYKKHLTLDYLIATYKKPIVSLINGVVMGGGAGLSMNTTFRIVTEKAVFAMPEASIGLFPDVGASYFLSRLPGYFGEYLGLTGARLEGAEIAASGLATHFVPSMKLCSLQKALEAVTSSNVSTIATITETFTVKANVKENSSFRRLKTINKCFSKGTVEEIIQSLENELEIGAEKWITNALSSLRSSCPTSLKIFLKSIRKGRVQNIEQCLHRDYKIASHLLRRTNSNDLYEGSRAKLFDKDNKPKWEPSQLELVNEEMVDQYFRNVNDEEWESLQFPDRSHSQKVSRL
ncbi:probable 3-hydroxyisobutyryl-CoA hydrolase 2 [Gastrolobium bilobum]|uniref:probable 3-hydroxyisobutyryl-CoA hydrolase 2 n=1 Tax=Gastrolobium bilobum TaxID=150636 RepID=UPI002AB06C37|nr:probable 3-hydroxyisobutyryl-CoA hydrolase 2 [Gastrolobium bilobum]